MKADRLEFYRSKLRGTPVADLGRAMWAILLDATQEAEREEREAMKPAIIEACKAHTREMEGYSYFGSNPGVAEDDYEDVADKAVEIRMNFSTGYPGGEDQRALDEAERCGE